MLIGNLDLLPGLPGLRLSMVLSLVVAVTIGIWVAPRISMPTWRLVLWLIAVLIPVAYTWTASTVVANLHVCSQGMWFYEIATAKAPKEAVANILLFVPAGAAAWLWRTPQQRIAALGVVLAMPPIIETGQLLMRWLHRACQYGDIANNLLGAVIGFSLVAGVAVVVPVLKPAAPHSGSSNL